MIDVDSLTDKEVKRRPWGRAEACAVGSRPAFSPPLSFLSQSLGQLSWRILGPLRTGGAFPVSLGLEVDVALPSSLLGVVGLHRWE